jgi:predicted RNase H-like nuclease (RuvC/YqgF family)
MDTQYDCDTDNNNDLVHNNNDSVDDGYGACKIKDNYIMDSITILSLEIKDLKKQLAEYERTFEVLEDEINKINDLLDIALKVTHTGFNKVVYPLDFNNGKCGHTIRY